MKANDRSMQNLEDIRPENESIFIGRTPEWVLHNGLLG